MDALAEIFGEPSRNCHNRGDVVRYLVFESAKYGLRVVLVSNEMPPQDLLVHGTHIITQPHYTYNIKAKRSAVLRNNEAEELWTM